MHVKSVDVQTSSRWCGIEIRRGGANSGVVLAAGPWLRITRSVVKNFPVTEYGDVNIHSLTHASSRVILVN
ncbi:hypothetical protein TNCV_634381 [Trichonephila clavipes]|nr:hypothetical protein TNCV_634381 [Trichonephila clavipes]